MLKNPIKQNDVISLKLVTGEEVIGRMVSITSDQITIKKAFTLGQGQEGVGLIPWAFTFEPSEDITFDRRNVIAHSPTFQKIADSYTQATSSIQTADASVLNNLGGQ